MSIKTHRVATTNESSWKIESRIIITAMYHPNMIAQMATDMVTKWSLVAAEPDGEDSQGRAKLRLATPEEMVARACKTAELLWAEFVGRGWLLDIPEITDAGGEADGQG